MSRPAKIYAVNMKRLALLLLPTFWRKPLIGGLIYAGVSVLGRQLGELREYRKETGCRLLHNGQVCKLRGVLNDKLDPVERRITIEDSETAVTEEASNMWLREVGRWVILPRRGNGAAITHRSGFSGTSNCDFWVELPQQLKNEETVTRVKGIVNMYKLASKRYTINYK